MELVHSEIKSIWSFSSTKYFIRFLIVKHFRSLIGRGFVFTRFSKVTGKRYHSETGAKLILTVSCFLHRVNYFPLRGRDFLEWYFSAIQSQVGSTKKLLSSTYNLPPEHFTPPLLPSDSVKLIILLGIQKIHSRRILYNVYISHWDPCAKVNTKQEKYIWN